MAGLVLLCTYKDKIACTGVDIENGGSKVSDLVAPGAASFWNLTYENCKFTESKCEFTEGNEKGEYPIWEKKLEGTLTKGTKLANSAGLALSHSQAG
jgi:hypothetical protein